MADLSQTAASVKPGSGAVIDRSYVFGETVAAGAPVYLSGSGASAKWMNAQADSAAHAAVRGVAICSGSLDQPAAVQTAGAFTVGATVVAGKSYYVSNTAGKLCPEADIANTMYAAIVCIATNTTTAYLLPKTIAALHG